MPSITADLRFFAYRGRSLIFSLQVVLSFALRIQTITSDMTDSALSLFRN
jgi:hypothetical protein